MPMLAPLAPLAPSLTPTAGSTSVNSLLLARTSALVVEKPMAVAAPTAATINTSLMAPAAPAPTTTAVAPTVTAPPATLAPTSLTASAPAQVLPNMASPDKPVSVSTTTVAMPRTSMAVMEPTSTATALPPPTAVTQMLSPPAQPMAPATLSADSLMPRTISMPPPPATIAPAIATPERPLSVEPNTTLQMPRTSAIDTSMLPTPPPSLQITKPLDAPQVISRDVQLMPPLAQPSAPVPLVNETVLAPRTSLIQPTTNLDMPRSLTPPTTATIQLTPNIVPLSPPSLPMPENIVKPVAQPVAPKVAFVNPTTGSQSIPGVMPDAPAAFQVDPTTSLPAAAGQGGSWWLALVGAAGGFLAGGPAGAAAGGILGALAGKGGGK